MTQSRDDCGRLDCYLQKEGVRERAEKEQAEAWQKTEQGKATDDARMIELDGTTDLNECSGKPEPRKPSKIPWVIQDVAPDGKIGEADEKERNMKDLMVDLETLGCKSDAVIVQIGACYFDRYTGETGDTFSRNIHMQDCIDQGLTIDGSTLDFWFHQPIRTWLDGSGGPVRISPLEIVLTEFQTFTQHCEFAWAHAGFDFPILFTAYRKLGLQIPFHYRAVRDLRTLVDLGGVDHTQSERPDAHDALADCRYQVEYASRCFRRLRGAGL